MSPFKPELGAFRAEISNGYGWGSILQKARSLSVQGWVKNQPDGSVTVYAEGYKESLGKYLALLKKGPQGATVSNLSLKELPYSGSCKDFEIEF